MDAALRDEFIAKIDAIASDPLAHVRRSLPPFEPIGAWTLEYASDFDPALHVVAIFAAPDSGETTITLAMVRLLSREIDES